MKDVMLKNAVKLKRVERGDLTQGELAKQVGVTRQTMNLIEAQKYNPTIKVCLQIAKVLDVKLDELFWMEDEA
ncbi:helix-turn-helix transcriptional regulator [Bhargavaea ginsengi]|uniref:helix-turn-helix transcriptional regulator n=1 Tax=Bhargavaea ginsengi TaxID=426757 RepID=UPI00203E6027|nr:helix-turn-helix transcriptional regulator [Bhargavaea ginsengi]